MSFIYPRLLKITRPNKATFAGFQGERGLNQADETTIATNVPASVQEKRGSSGGSDVPSGSSRTKWTILTPLSALSRDAVQHLDIITDDLGIRYQVIAPYWNSLGYKIEAERLEM